MSFAIRIHETGGPEVLRWERVELSEPPPGHVLVRQTVVGVNFIDTYHRSGLYPLEALPSGIGMEAAGVVEKRGADVEGLGEGDRVGYAAGPPGAYTEFRLMRADRLVPLPSEIDDTTAAAMMLKGMTVEYLIRRTFRVEPHHTVLLHAAAGGVGLLACQWLRELGATVVGTVGTDQKAELARAHGCTHTIVYTRESFVERVREITDGQGVPVVFDSVGATTFQGSLECLSPRGLLVSFGNASGKPPPFDPALLAQKGSLFLTRPVLMHYTQSHDDLITSAKALFDVVRAGAVKVEVHQQWPLAQAAEAHRALESRATTASSVLIV